MKIGLVLSKPPKYSETFFISKIKGLQSAGYSVNLYVQENPDNFKLCPVITSPNVYRNKIVQLLNSLLVLITLLPFIKRLFRFIKHEMETGRSSTQIMKNIYNNSHILKANLDWIHFGFATMALQSESVAKAINAKMAVSLRGFDIAIFPVNNPNSYKILWKKVDKVHSISNDLLDLAIGNGMSSETPFEIIPPAINIEKFNTTIKSVVINSGFKFLTVARLHWKKGLAETLEALAILKSKGIDFKYTIVGEGSQYEEIMYAIHQLDLENEVALVGKKSHEEIKQYLMESNVYLQYSISEGFCNAVLEAQSMGLLCVVSNAEGLPENVIHNVTGIVVEKRKPKLLAKAIENLLLLTQEERDSMSLKAQDRVKNEFNLKKQSEEFIAFYE